MAYQKKKRFTLLIFIALILIAAIAIACYDRYHHSHQKFTSNAQTTSKSPTAQSNYSSGNKRPVSSAGGSQGGVVPNSTPSTGKATGSPTTSTSGVITLTEPTQNELIQNNAIVTGTAQVPIVQFRLIDNKSGVIAQGQLNVINGSFSGTLKFTPSSSSGELDVFSFDPSSGSEVNEIHLPVRFQL